MVAQHAVEFAMRLSIRADNAAARHMPFTEPHAAVEWWLLGDIRGGRRQKKCENRHRESHQASEPFEAS